MSEKTLRSVSVEPLNGRSARGAAIDDPARDRIQALESALRAQDNFLAMLAHELRNPLAPIRSAGLVVRALGGSDERLVRAGDVLERQTAHLSRLVEDLLDATRMTRGGFALKREFVTIRSILARAVETTQPQMAARRHAFALRIASEELVVHADPVRLVQVISNLLDNAAKYTPEGGRIDVEALREAGHAVVRVRDTGVGIPPGMLVAIFEPFTRVSRARDLAAGGLGLGLSLVKQLVELHGGCVEAKSGGPGTGSEFDVRFPLAGADAIGQPSVSLAQ